MIRYFKLVIAVACFLSLISCKETTTDPNAIGGETNLDYTKPGTEFGVTFSADAGLGFALNDIKDSVRVIKNNNGIVTTRAEFRLTYEQFLNIDTLLGTHTLPEAAKLQLIDKYVALFGGTLDTTDKNNMVLDFILKNKVTSEGIQGFVYGGGDESKPFTIVKYASAVGDKYEFTDSNGKKYTRTVVSKAEKEDWSLGFLNVKTIRVEEQIDDPVMNKITYVANHKFGLVGLILNFKSGKELSITLMSMNPL